MLNPCKITDHSGNQMAEASYWWVCFDLQTFSHIEKQHNLEDFFILKYRCHISFDPRSHLLCVCSLDTEHLTKELNYTIESRN